MYSVKVVCAATYTTAPKPVHIFILTQASIALAPVTNRMHLSRRQLIISLVPTGKTLDELSREKKWHAII